jgi:hypothetical protein
MDQKCHVAVGAAVPTPVNWLNSTLSPSVDTNCTAAADPTACECGRLGTIYKEVEEATYDLVTTAIINRLDPRRTAVMTANATKQIEYIRNNKPEQVPYITSNSNGADYRNRSWFRLTDLIKFYFSGPATFGADGTVNAADEALQYQYVRPSMVLVALKQVCSGTVFAGKQLSHCR